MRSCFLTLLFSFAVAAAAPAQGKKPEIPDANLKSKVRIAQDTDGHFRTILFIGFTTDDKKLVTVGQDRQVLVWDVATGKRLQKLLLPHVSAIHSAALSPDDRTVAVGVWGRFHDDPAKKSGPGILLVNVNDGQIVPLVDQAGPKHIVRGLAFSPKGDQLAAGDWNALRIWSHLKKVWNKGEDLKTPGLVKLLKPREYPPLVDEIRHIQFNPAGDRVLAVAFDTANGLSVYDPKPGGEKKALGSIYGNFEKNRDRIFGACWSPKADSVFTGGPCMTGGLSHWDVEIEKGDGKFGKLLKHINPNNAKPGPKGKVPNWVSPATTFTQVQLLDDKKILLTGNALFGSGGKIGAAVYDLEKGTLDDRIERVDLGAGLSRTAVAHKTSLAATTVNAGRDLWIWKPDNGDIVHRIIGTKSPVRVGWLKSKDRYVLAWGYGQNPNAAAFGTFSRAFDLEDLEFVDTDPNTFNPKNYAGRMHVAKIEPETWTAEYYQKDTITRVQVQKDKKNMALLHEPIFGIPAFSLVPAADKKMHLVYGAENAIKLVNAVNGKVIREYGGPAHMQDIAPSPDGKYVAVATGIGSIRIQSLETPLQLELVVDKDEWVLWDPAGYYAASPGGERLVGWSYSNGLREPATFHPISRFRDYFNRPDIIAIVLKEGKLTAAVGKANKALKDLGVKVKKEVDVDDVLPPLGHIVSIDKSKLADGVITIKASAEVAAAKDRITKLELLADGRPLFGKDGVKVLKTPEKDIAATWVVTLPPGDHKLTVRADSEKSWSISTAEYVTYTPKAPMKLPKARLHVLAFGASEYMNHKGLNVPSPANDAKKIAATLQAKCGLPLFKEVVPQVFTGNQATSGNARKAITDLQDKVEAEDLVVMYFGGHGVKSNKGGLYLLTYDSDMEKLDETAVTGSWLRSQLPHVNCRVLLIIDACHSGAIAVNKVAPPPQFGQMKPAGDDLTQQLGDDYCGVVVWCSARGKEKAQIVDAAKDEDKHGLFTLTFLKALEDKGGASYDSDTKRMNLLHVQPFIFDRVKKDSGQRQHPMFQIPATVIPFELREVAAK